MALSYLAKMDTRLKKTEGVANREQELVASQLPFENGKIDTFLQHCVNHVIMYLLTDDEIAVFWQDKMAVLQLEEYLAKTIDWDSHWSTQIIQKMFTKEYRTAHTWPSQSYVTLLQECP